MVYKMKKQDFGGGWTEEKLKRIAKYLPAYTTIFKSNTKASFLKTYWKQFFYSQNLQTNLFGEPSLIKDADFDKIKEYFIKRLKSVFPMVANNPLILRNNNKVPIFMLCFAAENPTALKIASHILGK